MLSIGALLVVCGAAAFSVQGCGGGGSSSSSSTYSNAALGANVVSQQEANTQPVGLSYVGSSQGATLPSSVDLSSSPALPPIGNQGYQSSCVAWSVGYGLASYTSNIGSGASGSSAQTQGSPSDAYAKTLALMSQQGESAQCNGGTDPVIAMQMLIYQGIDSMANVPYQSASQDTAGFCTQPSGNAYFGIRAAHRIDINDPVAIKRELAGGNVVSFEANLYQDFRSYSGGIYRSNLASAIGAHQMLLVGYDDAKGAWKVMNSWGTAWGEAGFMWMSYSTFQSTAVIALVADEGAYNVPPNGNGSPTITALQSAEYFDYYYYVAYLVLPFTLSEPIRLQKATIVYQDGTVIGPFYGDFWADSSYVWASLQYPYYFPAGNYTLTLDGYTRAGNQVEMVKTVPLSPNAHPSSSMLPNSGKGRSSETLPDMPKAMTARLGPGMKVNFCGHMMVTK
ncbi:MAG: C1 family peptidase [Armatimonadetes bacterium]|nr:C1 family peptidase [Armatimonadota bacterium]